MLDDRAAAATAKAADAGREGLRRSVSAESVRGTVLGLPTDPEKEFDEAMSELKAEVDSARKAVKKKA